MSPLPTKSVDKLDLGTMAVTTERCTGGIAKPLPPEWFIQKDTSAEMRWEAMQGQGYEVPTERFFVRNHTSTPRIDPLAYELEIHGPGLRGGAVRFSYDELTSLPSVERTVAIECAGNGRALFESQQGMRVPGTAWGLGAIGVTRWRGVPLSEVLERAGVRDDAVDVMPVGLDDPYVADGIDHGRVRRPLPVGKALDDVILAYEMNGEVLPPDHGYPVRLVVPGWIGIASVKWVGRIEVSTVAAVVAVEHEVVPAVVLGAGGQERVRAAVGGDAAAGRAGAARARVVGERAGQARRREHRRRRDLAAGAPARAEPPLRVGALLAAVDAAAQRADRADLARHRRRRPAPARPRAVQRRRLHVLRGRAPPGDGQRVSRPASITSVVPVT